MTSRVMKKFGQLVKRFLTDKVQGLLDPMQYAYWVKGGVDDATTTLLNYLYNHLEGTQMLYGWVWLVILVSVLLTPPRIMAEYKSFSTGRSWQTCMSYIQRYWRGCLRAIKTQTDIIHMRPQ